MISILLNTPLIIAIFVNVFNENCKELTNTATLSKKLIGDECPNGSHAFVVQYNSKMLIKGLHLNTTAERKNFLDTPIDGIFLLNEVYYMMIWKADLDWNLKMEGLHQLENMREVSTNFFTNGEFLVNLEDNILVNSHPHSFPIMFEIKNTTRVKRGLVCYGGGIGVSYFAAAVGVVTYCNTDNLNLELNEDLTNKYNQLQDKIRHDIKSFKDETEKSIFSIGELNQKMKLDIAKSQQNINYIKNLIDFSRKKEVQEFQYQQENVQALRTHISQQKYFTIILSVELFNSKSYEMVGKYLTLCRKRKNPKPIKLTKPIPTKYLSQSYLELHIVNHQEQLTRLWESFLNQAKVNLHLENYLKDTLHLSNKSITTSTKIITANAESIHHLGELTVSSFSNLRIKNSWIYVVVTSTLALLVWVPIKMIVSLKLRSIKGKYKTWHRCFMENFFVLYLCLFLISIYEAVDNTISLVALFI